MTTVCIIQARMTSSRLPGKVLLPLVGRPVIHRVVERARAIPGVDSVCVAIPDTDEHALIAAALEDESDIRIVRGSEHDVLARFAQAITESGADTVMRITSDCPLLDPSVSGAVLASYRAANVLYAATAMESGFPLGLGTEVVSAALLMEAHEVATDPYEREHVTPYVWRRPELFPGIFLDYAPNLRSWRLTLDTELDYQVISTIYDALHRDGEIFGLEDIRDYVEHNPAVLEVNASVAQKAYQWEEDRDAIHVEQSH